MRSLLFPSLSAAPGHRGASEAAPSSPGYHPDATLGPGGPESVGWVHLLVHFSCQEASEAAPPSGCAWDDALSLGPLAVSSCLWGWGTPVWVPSAPSGHRATTQDRRSTEARKPRSETEGGEPQSQPKHVGSHRKSSLPWTLRPLETRVHRVQTELSQGVGGPGPEQERPGVGLRRVC